MRIWLAAGSETPWVGVRIQLGNDGGKLLDAALRQAFGGIPALPARGFKLKGNTWWPVIRRLEPNPVWWQDLDAWRGSLLAAVQETWQLASPVVDRCLSTDSTYAKPGSFQRPTLLGILGSITRRA